MISRKAYLDVHRVLNIRRVQLTGTVWRHSRVVWIGHPLVTAAIILWILDLTTNRPVFELFENIKLPLHYSMLPDKAKVALAEVYQVFNWFD